MPSKRKINVALPQTIFQGRDWASGGRNNALNPLALLSCKAVPFAKGTERSISPQRQPKRGIQLHRTPHDSFCDQRRTRRQTRMTVFGPSAVQRFGAGNPDRFSSPFSTGFLLGLSGCTVRSSPRRLILAKCRMASWTRAAVHELVGESATLYRPPYLIARGPKDDSPVNSRKLTIYWVSEKVAPRIS